MRPGNILEVHGGQSRIYLDHLATVVMAKAREGTLTVGSPNPILTVMRRAVAKRTRQSTRKRTA